MRLRHWLIFAGWQLAGSLAGYSAHHVDRLSWAISGIMLFPGTYVTGYVFRVGGPGNNWPSGHSLQLPSRRMLPS